MVKGSETDQRHRRCQYAPLWMEILRCAVDRTKNSAIEPRVRVKEAPCSPRIRIEERSLLDNPAHMRSCGQRTLWRRGMQLNDAN